MNDLISISAFLSIVLISGATSAQTVTPQSALESAMEKNLKMKIAIDKLRSADLLVEKEDAKFIPIWTNELNFGFGRNASLNATGLISNPKRSLLFSSGLVHSLPVGTQISVGLQFGGTQSLQANIDPLDEVTSYNTSLNLNFSQPLLRGFGTEVGNATRMSAKAARTLADAQKLNSTSTLVKELVSAYWDLWLAQKNLGIQMESSKVVQRGLHDAEIKLEAGTVAPAEIVALRIEEARMQELVAEAASTARQKSIALSSLMGIDATDALDATIAPTEIESPTLEEARMQAKSSAYLLMEARAQIELQKIDESVANNVALPKLDATAGLSVSGVGAELGDSISSLAGFDDYLISIGLRLELPLSNRALNAESGRKKVALSLAKSQYEQTKREIDAQISTLLNRLKNDKVRLTLAKKTSKLATQNVDAQSARFEIGRSTTLQVIDAIRSLREAEFRVVQIRVGMAIQKLELGHVIGTLLNQ